MGCVITRKQKIRLISMLTWVIQRVEELVMRDGRDISDGNGPLFSDRFDNENDFSTALHEGDIEGVAQNNDDQDNDNGDDDGNMNEN